MPCVKLSKPHLLSTYDGTPVLKVHVIKSVVNSLTIITVESWYLIQIFVWKGQFGILNWSDYQVEI